VAANVVEEEAEQEAPINHNERKTSWTSQNTKTNKSVFVSLAVEKVRIYIHFHFTNSDL
jgi:hypothetical protein